MGRWMLLSESDILQLRFLILPKPPEVSAIASIPHTRTHAQSSCDLPKAAQLISGRPNVRNHLFLSPAPGLFLHNHANQEIHLRSLWESEPMTVAAKPLLPQHRMESDPQDQTRGCPQGITGQLQCTDVLITPHSVFFFLRKLNLSSIF